MEREARFKESEKETMITVNKATRVACKVVGINMDQFASRSRRQECADARGIACKLVREINGWTYERIGNDMETDKSTVRYSVKRVEKALGERSVLGKLYRECAWRVK